MVGGTSVTQVPGERQRFWRAVSTSTDGGETWTLTWQDDVQRAGGNQVFDDFDAFAGRVVIMGDPNVPVTSTTDFVTFRADVPSQMILLEAMASSPAAIVSVGRYGVIISSTDGANWSSAHSNTVGGNLRAAAFGDGIWIVAGQSGLASSSDGIAWRMLPSGDTFDAGSLAYGNGRYVVGAMDGRIAVSTDKGATWSESGTRSTVLHFAFTNGRFVGSTGLISSTDCLTWTTEVPAPGGTGRWLGVFTVGNVFYAVGTTDPDRLDRKLRRRRDHRDRPAHRCHSAERRRHQVRCDADDPRSRRLHLHRQGKEQHLRHRADRSLRRRRQRIFVRRYRLTGAQRHRQ